MTKNLMGCVITLFLIAIASAQSKDQQGQRLPALQQELQPVYTAQTVNAPYTVSVPAIQPVYSVNVQENNQLHKVLRTIGLSLRQVSDPVVYEHISLDKSTGLVVQEVQSKLAAAQVGIKSNDIIAKVDGKPVVSVDDFVSAYQSASNDDVELKVFQGGKLETLVINREKAIEQARDYKIGVYIEEIPDMLAAHLALKDGVYIKQVIPDSPAESAGIMPNDIVISIDGTDIDSREALSDVVDQSAGKALELKLIRAGKPVELSVTPVETPDSSDSEKNSVFVQYPSPSILWNGQSQSANQITNLTTAIEKLSKQVAKMQKQLDKP